MPWQVEAEESSEILSDCGRPEEKTRYGGRRYYLWGIGEDFPQVSQWETQLEQRPGDGEKSSVLRARVCGVRRGA